MKPEQNTVMPQPAPSPLEASAPGSRSASSQPTSLRSSPAPTPPFEDAVNPQKNRKGIDRVWHAAGYSMAGLRAGWFEPAFRQEALASIILLPAAFWLGRNWLETMLLTGTVVLILIVELLNTGIETAIDRIGPEWHDLSKRAKDMGSAAVLLSIVLCAATWLMALFARFTA